MVRIEVSNVIFIAGSGTVVVGHVREGEARAGHVTAPLALEVTAARKLEVKSVERLSSLEGRRQAIGIVFHDPPNLNEMKRLFPPASILDLYDPSQRG